jgi:hypothetical protein
MRVASQIWQIVFASQTLQVFHLALRKKAQYIVVYLEKTCSYNFLWEEKNRLDDSATFEKMEMSKDNFGNLKS